MTEDFTDQRAASASAIPEETRSLEDTLHELACLEWVRSNTPELEGDATARRELRARTAALRRRLDELFAAILAPSESETRSCRWFHKGQKLPNTPRSSLQARLSRVCDDMYPSTPRIRNELINRRELSSAAAAARRSLIDAMICCSDQPELGIEGTPPQKSMYLSLLAGPGIHRKSAHGCAPQQPHASTSSMARSISIATVGYLGQEVGNTATEEDALE
ncbi:MAG: hypothetical protein ABSG68_24905 [Thermoguttaceae bacterium]